MRSYEADKQSAKFAVDLVRLPSVLTTPLFIISLFSPAHSPIDLIACKTFSDRPLASSLPCGIFDDDFRSQVCDSGRLLTTPLLVAQSNLKYSFRLHRSGAFDYSSLAANIT